jgi:hypothetical protein
MKGSVDRYNNSEERKEPHTFLCTSVIRDRGITHTHTHTQEDTGSLGNSKRHCAHPCFRKDEIKATVKPTS